MQLRYVYSWWLAPREGLDVELRVEAPSAVVARREIAVFLEHHDGLGWTLRGVRRLVSAAWEDGPGPAVTFVGPGEPDRS